ncbi:MAPEG family protein [Acetobacteraceae bacterium H6797]|nr:MAPEG family protein [Acetobacteraceae bacterium H6797]
MAPSITPIYAALLALIYLFLCGRISLRRRARNILIGLGGDAELERRVRVQGNFIEYVPFALLLILMAELRGAPGLVLNGLGLALLLGRSLHAWGFSQGEGEDLRFRFAGMVLTFTALMGGALAAVWG